MAEQIKEKKISSTILVLIEGEVRHLLGIMGFNQAQVSCVMKDTKDKTGNFRQQLCISINEREAGRMLIGINGTCLAALSHVMRLLIRRKLNNTIYVAVDVNGYLALREHNLLNLAQEAARQAGQGGRAVVLPPMGAFERHIVHTLLAKRQDVSTESLGEEPNRRVVVRPIFV